ncbi:tRNA (guanine-N(1)-)-methyltransferase [Kwoniella heveanensis BCC8398]|uniref:tRNA (guanine(9)-N1)-methyltransferase n=1 Tax=Kwoniella heveanensis BCC8398 TaxID=1296120 RepID=A0A1B9GPF8_9TREE|nr:tRNA (guanine-N(1)-)-methyltransferase [Kwoniella heveanensis BCC8398]
MSDQADSIRPEGMSKSAMKRAARQARLEALKPIKRAAEKERRKARAAQLAEGYANGTLSEADREIFERRKQTEKERRVAKRKIEHGEQGSDWRGGIVVDLGFDELMNEQEISSMSSQLGYVYSSNRTSKRPINTVIHTSFSPTVSPRLWERMNASNWHKWSRSYWWAEGLDHLNNALTLTSASGFPAASQGADASAALSSSAAATTSLPAEASAVSDSAAGASKADESLVAHLSGDRLPLGLEKGRHRLVYLSADAEEELTTLSEDDVYIIGGIVDRNRYKNLCQDKAEKLGIRTARLPIGSFIANLPTRKVLTVNQVFDILVQYIALEDWKAAFEAVIPQRKYHESKKAKRAHTKSGGDEEDNASQDDDEANEAVAEEGTIEQEHGSQGDEGLMEDEEAMMNQ